MRISPVKKQNSLTIYADKFTQYQNKNTITKHIFVGETRVVSRLSHSDYFDITYEEANVYYYHSDHLGSTSYVTDLNGDEFEHMVYTPYGESWIDEGSNKHIIGFRFTSKELDDETGLYYFGARYLDPKTSRWMSVDPAGPELINPNRDGFSAIEGNNWYGYVSNNPINYIDPTGMAEIYSRKMDSREKKSLAVGNFLGFRHSIIRTNLTWTNQKAIFDFAQDGPGQYESPHNSGSEYTILYSGMDDVILYNAAKKVLDPNNENEDFSDSSYKFPGNDCNDFTDAVFNQYETDWKNNEIEKNEGNDGFNIDDAWDKHYSEITARAGETVIYNDLNYDPLPEE